jgi:cystathionine gamma-lyase
MSGFGGMITIQTKGTLENSREFISNLDVFSCAESLGAVESLVNHPAIMTHASVPPEIRHELGIGDTTIRLSVGIETAEDLIADLQKGLDAMTL